MSPRPLRVCFLSQLAHSLFDTSMPPSFGGAELQLYLLATELATDPCYDVHFIVQDFDQPLRSRIQGVTVWRTWRPFKGARWALPVRWSAVLFSTFSRLVAQRADVYIGAAAGYVTALMPISAGLNGGKSIYWMASDADTRGTLLRFDAERRLFLWGLRRADVVLAQNRHQQRELLRLHDKESTVLPNAFPVPETPPAVAKDTVLWVASAQALKQPDMFLELARRFPDTPFTMVMPPNDLALFARIREQAGGIPNLTFIERVPLAQIQAYFDRALVFVNTSTVEGYPNTFLQAAMGTTPVLSLSTNPDAVLTRHGFGRAADGDFERLAADLRELLADDALRHDMGRRGFAYVRAGHDVRVVAEELKGVMKQLTCSRQGRGGAA